jgi:hypothetical protein
MSLVQHEALAVVPAAASAGVKGSEHLLARGVARMLVVRCRSHCAESGFDISLPKLAHHQAEQCMEGNEVKGGKR